MSTPKLCVVIDVEATCWDHNADGTFTEKQKQESEIIEFGITTISMPDKQIVESRSILVTPTRSEISEFCTQLTSITPEMVEKEGILFAEAISSLDIDFRVGKNMWASWGCYDRDAILRQCTREFVRSPFNNQHLNIKAMFGWKFGEFCGVTRACKKLGIPFEGTHHRGVDDSRNIARILLALEGANVPV